jgi:translation elongation factor EF-G
VGLKAAVTVANAANPTATIADPTVLKGFGVSAITVGPTGTQASCGTPAATGVATCNGTASAGNPVLSFTLIDLTAAAATYSTTVSFSIADVAPGKRTLTATVPATLVADGLGGVTLTVAANAVLTFSGTDNAGVAVSGTATNLAVNTIASVNNVITVDMGQLVSAAQAKAGNISQLANLTTAGTYDVTIGVGVPIGLNSAGVMTGLFPLTSAGRTITAKNVVTQ